MLLMFGAPMGVELLIIALVVGLPALVYFMAAFIILTLVRKGARADEVEQLRRRVEELEREVRRTEKEA